MAAAGTGGSADVAFDSEDPQAVWGFLDEAYGASLRVEKDPGRLTFHRNGGGLVSVDDMDLEGRIGFDADPISMFTVMDCVSGRGSTSRKGLTDDFEASDIVSASTPGHGYVGFCGPVHIRLLNVDLGILDDVAAETDGAERPLVFRELRIRARRDQEIWRRMVDFVDVAARGDRTLRGGLAERELARMAARTALSVLPNSTWDEPTSAALQRDGRDASAATVRRAVAHIDSATDLDLSVADIARAAYVSPRALQAAFRRHLATTPMQYLQQARLRRARRDLLDADGSTTVAGIASRWGFYNHGRFAATYRAEFGELPSVTLARAVGTIGDLSSIGHLGTGDAR